jgi:hypothetical protein
MKWNKLILILALPALLLAACGEQETPEPVQSNLYLWMSSSRRGTWSRMTI